MTPLHVLSLLGACAVRILARPLVESAFAKLALSYKDCGDDSYDARVTSISTKSLTIGGTTTVALTAHMGSKEVTGATYTLTMKGGPHNVKLLDCHGNASLQKECDVKDPSKGKVGSLKYQPVKFPIKPGEPGSVPQVDVTLNSTLTPALETTTTLFKVTGDNGDKVICVKFFTNPEALAPAVTLPMSTPPLIKSSLANLPVSFHDCGDDSTNAKVTDVEPKSLTPGSTTMISGSGHLSKDITGGTYTLTMTGLGGMKLLDCSGDASQQQECDIKAPLIGKVGSLVYKPVTFPIRAGNISGVPQVATTLNSGLLSSSETTTTTLKVTGANGDKVMCVEITTKSTESMQPVIV